MTLAGQNKFRSMLLQVRVLAMLTVLVAGGSALAQTVVVFVNGDPITAIDLEQRVKFLQLIDSKAAPPRQKVLDQLIDERLKVREGKRWGIEASDSEVNNSYAVMAGRMQKSGDGLTQELAAKGINASTLKARIRADIVWQQLVRGRYQSRLQLNDRDIVSHLEAKGKPEERDAVGYDYTMRPILLLIPPGAPSATYEARRREAEALRKSFRGCAESIPAVRAMRDVAVRDQVIRTSADLPEPLRKVLDGIPVGQLTAPEVTRHGIEMFAICARTETKSDTPGRRAARDTLMNERFEQESRRYLQQLRRNALIEPGR